MTLADYLTVHLAKPFVWGENDCVLFAARWAVIATGIDHLAGVPRWHGIREAVRLVNEAGGLQQLMDARLQRVAPHQAKDGDIALYGRCLCIVSGPHIVGPNVDGLVFISRMEAECAWSL